ncbi:hypothetical protein [Thiocapsa sp.]|uniref:hypothetical protein n=1 Tax=Thiocapsa sp. TaxID=2024551 RepID=UPI0025D89658|nr:hypothetical protein [Thiocapsa sp.]
MEHERLDATITVSRGIHSAQFALARTDRLFFQCLWGQLRLERHLLRLDRVSMWSDQGRATLQAAMSATSDAVRG